MSAMPAKQEDADLSSAIKAYRRSVKDLELSQVVAAYGQALQDARAAREQVDAAQKALYRAEEEASLAGSRLIAARDGLLAVAGGDHYVHP